MECTIVHNNVDQTICPQTLFKYSPDSTNKLGQQFTEGEELQYLEGREEQYTGHHYSIRLVPSYQEVKVHVFALGVVDSLYSVHDEGDAAEE